MTLVIYIQIVLNCLFMSAVINILMKVSYQKSGKTTENPLLFSWNRYEIERSNCLNLCMTNSFYLTGVL